MYDELLERLHKRIALTTAGSPLQDDLKEAADAIERLTAFAHYVAGEAFDEYEELSNSAFFELVCRKLNKIGVVETDGEYWSYEPPKEET